MYSRHQIEHHVKKYGTLYMNYDVMANFKLLKAACMKLDLKVNTLVYKCKNYPNIALQDSESLIKAGNR